MFLSKLLTKNARYANTLRQPMATQVRAFSNYQFKQPVTHKIGTTEEVRPEFLEMWNELDEMINKAMPMVKRHYEECGTPQTTRINNFALPEEIIKELGPVNKEGSSIDECMDTFKLVMKYSVNTMHPYFWDKLWAGSDPIGQVAEFIVTVLNTAVHVYHVAPVFTIMEREIMKVFAAKFGFDPETADGVINPGGTMSNIMAVLVARNEHFPHVRMDGWKPEDQPVAFTSRQAHYSVTRGGMVAGMGMNNFIKVAGDRWTGEMIPEALDEAIREQKALGKTPFFVNSVGGSTVMGSFDDQYAISKVCKEHGLWHHIDGCWGGVMAFSENTNYLYKGSHLADSVAINAHKALGAPNQCSYLLVNNRPNALIEANCSGATYLFQETPWAKYDLADKTLSCGRKADSLKLWMLLKKHGLDGIGKIADEAMEKAKYITKQIEAQPDKFEMINKPMATNVCFSYTPPAFRGKEYTFDQKSSVHQIIFERMIRDGTMMIQQNPLEEFNLPNFFRLTLKNEKSTLADMDYILENIDRLGQDLTPETV